MEKTKRVLDVTSKAETRKTEDGKRYIEGIIPYNSRSEEMWGFVEVISPTAFNKTISDGADVYAFWAHDDAKILGARKSKTLTMESRDDGLHFSIEMRDTPESIECFETVSRGDCSGVSFGFIAEKTSWDETVTPAIRTLTEVRLLEISPGVAFPAYPGAQSDAARRSLYAEGAPEFRTKFHNEKPKGEPLPSTPEPVEPLESRKEADEAEAVRVRQAELDLLKAMYGL